MFDENVAGKESAACFATPQIIVKFQSEVLYDETVYGQL